MCQNFIWDLLWNYQKNMWKVLLGSSSYFGDKTWPWKTLPPIERLGFNPEEGEVMCYEKSVNIFEQNMRERAKTTMHLCKGVAGGDCEAKSAGYQRKCKIFFCWTGKIQYQFVHSPNFKRVSAGAPWHHHAARCTTMLHQQLIEVWTLSAACTTHPPPFPSQLSSCLPTPILYNHRKGRS